MEAAETQQVKAVQRKMTGARVPASGGGEVTAVRCAGRCRGLKGAALPAECQRTTGTEDVILATYMAPAT